jgi:hypothetical protein
MIVSMIAALALQAAAPAATDTKAPPAKTVQADKPKTDDKNDPDKKVCRRQTPVGSSIETRVCKTRAEWDQDAANGQKLLEDAAAIGHR